MNDRLGVTCYPNAKLIGDENLVFAGKAIIDDFALLYAKAPVHIGRFVHIGAFASVIATAPIILEDFSGLSHGARLFTASEDFSGPGFGNPTVPLAFRNISTGPIHIGRFCVLGANSVVLPGVTIGEGATVGACSVVTKDLAPWGVYIGNRRVGERDRAGVLAAHERFLAHLEC